MPDLLGHCVGFAQAMPYAQVLLRTGVRLGWRETCYGVGTVWVTSIDKLMEVVGIYPVMRPDLLSA